MKPFSKHIYSIAVSVTISPCFQFMYGKSKSVIVEKFRTNGNMLLPTPGYDSHVSTVEASSGHLSLKENINHSQVLFDWFSEK